jgi:transcriptional regulator with XRE-family HTH domain
VERSRENWRIIGSNVRFYREAQGLTQSDLARLANVARRSLYALEHGHPSRAQTFERICAALGMDSQEMANSRHLPQVVDGGQPFYVHRQSEEHWYADVPLDNSRIDYQNAIQDPSERNRLGRLGLVPSFSHALSFVMPRGPGVIFYEVHLRQAVDIPAHLYHDWMVLCLRGAVIAALGGVETVLEEGDAMGAANWTGFTVEPATRIQASDLPPLLLAIGANRASKAAVVSE